MHNLVKNVLRGVKKRLFQYLGIIFLLIIVVATMTGLYGNSERVQKGFYTVSENSGSYDYRIKIEALNDFKNVDDALLRIKKIIKAQFPSTWEDYQEIISQVDQITYSDIQTNVLPSKGEINEKLKTYLLNWGINYRAILVNDILNHDFKNDSIFASYQISKSFLKSFSLNQDKKLFFSFEDAFYLNLIPYPDIPTEDNSDFDFSPYRDGFNTVYLTGGRKPNAIDEVVVNPTFAQVNHINLGEKLPIMDLKVVGFGYSYWGIIAEPTAENISPSPKETTQIFTTREWFNKYLNDNSNYLSKLTLPFFLKVKNNDSYFASKLESLFNDSFNFSYGNLLVADSEDLRSGFLKQNFNMQNIIFSAISFFVMLAAIFIVLSYVRKEIDLQKKQIGLIKALGYTNNEISFGFTLLIFLLSIISTLIGFALGLPLQAKFNSLSDFGFFLPLPTIHFSLISFMIGVLFVTVLFTISSYLQSYTSLTKNPLLLIYDRQTSNSSKWLAIFKKPFNYWRFKPRLAMSFALKSAGKLVLIFFTFVFVSFLLLFQSIATDVFDSKVNNLYNYVNSDVYYASKTVNMFQYNEEGKIEDTFYDWTTKNKLDPNKALTSDMLHVDSAQKAEYLMSLITTNEFKGYYITPEELNLLYENTHDLDNPNKCLEYIRPPGTNFIPEEIAKKICQQLTIFFDMLKKYSGMNPTSKTLPGISIGQIILDQNFYPNLEFTGNNPASWKNHNQGPLISKKNFIISLYNNSDPDNPLAWKSWFNLKEEKGLDIDPVFNSSHDLEKQEVTYVDGFGQEKTQTAYVVPTVISKSLAVLNKYKVNNEVLVLINTNNKFIPVVFKIKGISVTNLDLSHYYVNIDDLRRVVGFVDSNDKVLLDTFNNFYSKSKNILPLNSIDFAQPNNDYSMQGINDSKILISQDPLVFPLIKNRLNEMFGSIKSIIEISKWLTIFALAFVLIIIINMILDNNLTIIAMMKALGYRINEINLLIIGSYIFTLVLAFIFGTIFAYITWAGIVWVVAKFASTIFLLPINALTIFVSFFLIFVVIGIGYSVGLYFIKFKPVTSLLQSD